MEIARQEGVRRPDSSPTYHLLAVPCRASLFLWALVSLGGKNEWTALDDFKGHFQL